MNIEILSKLIEIHNNYNEVLVSGATFTGTVLAIFFTLITLPIENILSKYSQDLIKRIQRDFIFISCFVFLIFTFIYNVILIALGSSKELVMFSLCFTIESVLVLALLVVHTFYMLDVRNQLNDITSDIKKQIKSKIRKSESRKKFEFRRIMKFFNQK